VRTSVVLAIVALVLLGYILLVDKGKLSSGELEQRKGTALPELVRARISKLEIQLKGTTTVLTRDLEREDEDALWQVQAPYRAEADQDAVDTLLGELEWLDGRRNLGPVNATDHKRFGFDAPRLRLWFTVGDKRVPVIVGGESTRGDGVYVLVGDPPQAMIAGKDLIEGLRQDPGHFHTKTLHDGMLVATTTSIELTDAQGNRGVGKRSDELWGVLPDQKRLASTQTVQELIEALDSLRATRFVADAKGDLARYGVASPRLVVHVKKTRLVSSSGKGAKDDKASAGAGAAGNAGATSKPLREATSFELRVGNACQGYSGESHVLVAGTTKVLCASDADLEKLSRTAEQLREPRFLPFAEDELGSARIEHGGKVLALTSKDGVFSYELTLAGKPVAQGVAREGSVADWLKSLAAVQALQLDASEPSSVAGSNVITLTFGRFGSKPPYTVRALAGAAELLAQRGDEPSAASFPASTLELLGAEVARFRSLSVLALAEPSIGALEIQRGDAVERITRAAGSSFRIEAPVAATADPVLVPELTRLLSTLHAERFVADVARPEHGLSTPFAVVRIEHADGAAKVAKTESLTLGAETTGGRFAQRKGDAAVFVIGRQLVDLIGSPLADRAALAIPIERLSEAVVTHGSSRTRIVRQGESFAATEPAGLAPAAVRALAETLATLRATRAAGYAVDDPAFGFAKPFATVTIEVAAEGSGAVLEHALTLGADAGDGARYARRSDQPAVLVLSKETVARLLATAPAAPNPPAAPSAPAAAKP
jgi:hypothetical protein